jgi:hypothetical protein
MRRAACKLQHGCIRLSLALLLFVVAGHAAAQPAKKIDYELTGAVYDAATKQPLEGAYVIAGYRVHVSGPAADTTWCVKTRGMYTGKDGKFHFQIEKLDTLSPMLASAIKPGYFRGRFVFPERDVWKKQDARAYAGHDIFLNPQDSAKPQFLYGSGDEYCHHAATLDDAAAGIEFMKIQLGELVRLGASPRGIDAVKKMIQDLESFPSQSSSTR